MIIDNRDVYVSIIYGMISFTATPLRKPSSLATATEKVQACFQI